MKVIVVGGRTRADYIIESLHATGEDVVAVNSDREYCEYLSARHDIETFCGDGTKRQVLDDAGAARCDVLIALTSVDADSLIICQLGEHFFGIGSRMCVVSNPRNIKIFRRLGVTAVISETSILAQTIHQLISQDAEDAFASQKDPHLTNSFAALPDTDVIAKFSKHQTGRFHRIGSR
ncbi:MAG: TrkA family potassium uptake protein [Coriobacteriales bacterium]|nr:TrkA family potassium uptake protein [Coriobacteriales bacterium]